MQSSAIWRPRSKFIITVLEPTDIHIVEQTFRKIWTEYKLLNLVIVTKINQTWNIFGFNPYYENFLENLTGKDVFYNKLTNLNGYILNILMTRDEDVTKLIVEQLEGNHTTYKGKDGNFVMSILAKSNASYNVTNLHQLLGNDNPWRPINKGLLEHEKARIIRQYDADFILDSQAIMIHNMTEFLYPHSRDDTVFLVPKAKILSQYKQLSKIFQEGFSYILLFFIVGVPLIWFVFKLLHMRLKKESVPILKTFVEILLNNLRIALGSCMNRLPNNFFEKVFIIFLLFCNLIIGSYFQSILASILTVSTHEPQINTIKDLADSSLRPVGVPGDMAEVSEVLRVTGHEKLIPKLALLPLSLYYIHYRDFPTNACGFSNYDRMSMAAKIRPVLHVVQEHVVPTYLSFEVVAGSPYYDLFDRYILRILEAGLYDLWKNSYTFQFVIKIGIIDYDAEKGGYKDLTMKQFYGAYWILFIGWTTSSLFFAIEICYYRMKSGRLTG